MRLILIVLAGLVCGCQTTKPPKRDVEVGLDVPVGSPDKAKMTVTIKASF